MTAMLELLRQIRTNTNALDGGDGGGVAFAADLQEGVNKHLAVTLTVAATDYTVEIPDDVKIIGLFASATFRYAIATAATNPAAAVAGNAVLANWGNGGRYTSTGAPIFHVLGAGEDRVLHLRSETAGLVVHLQVA